MTKSKNKNQVVKLENKPITMFFKSETVPAKAAPEVKLKKRKWDDAVKNHSLFEYFKQNNSVKRKKITATITDEQNKMPVSSIAITYRTDGGGGGAAFDHRSLQLHTQVPTVVATPEDKVSLLKHKLKECTFDLKFGAKDETIGKLIPPIVHEIDKECGLLVIPGVSATQFATEEYNERKKFEFELIKRARLTGQPVLAICGGSWVLYQQFGGDIVDVHDHNYRGGMPRLLQTGKVGNNKPIHRINIASDALLLKATLNVKPSDVVNLPVNSVHSYAPDKTKIPAGLRLSALALPDDELAPIKATDKNKNKMQPDISLEAFETIHGAPILGVEWHPEAYTANTPDEHYPKNQRHLIHYMMQAGQAYQCRRRMTEELKEKHQGIQDNLQKTKLILKNNTILKSKVKPEQPNQIRFFNFRCNKVAEPRHTREIKAEIKMKENYLIEKGIKRC